MRSLIQKIWTFITLRKFTSAFIAIIILIIGYYGYNSLFGSTAVAKYVMTTVEKGTLTTSVSGSGQVDVVNQIDINADITGSVEEIVAQNGQEVKEGDVILVLDSTDARKAVRDAALNLESAQLSLEKLTSDFEIASAKNEWEKAKSAFESLKISQTTDARKAEDATQKADDNIQKSFEDAFNSISETFADLPSIKDDLDDIKSKIRTFAQGSNSKKIEALRDTAIADFYTAKNKYDDNIKTFKTVTRYSDISVIKSLAETTTETTKAFSQAAKSQSDFLNAWIDYRDSSDDAQTYLDTVTDDSSKLNDYISSLLTTQRSLEDYIEAKSEAEDDLSTISTTQPSDLKEAELLVQEKLKDYTDLVEGKDLDVRSQQIQVQQKQNDLADAQEDLAKCTVRAPFDGVVAKADYFKVGNDVSSTDVVATIVTKQTTAEISLNEVDVSKVKVGQKAILTFDAIEDLEVTGKVVDVDTLSTISQNVVTYNAVIILDTEDDQIRPGMSVSATIITDVKQDILLLSSSAVQSSDDDSYYVEVFENEVPEDTTGEGITSSTPPVQKTVEVGISDDTSTEIISGLSEGDNVVLKTTTESVATTTSSSSKNAGGMGMLGGGPRD